MRKNLKHEHCIKKVTGSEVTLTHKAQLPSNYFFSSSTRYQAEQIKKGVICVQIFIEIHQTEHSRVHFQRVYASK